MRHIVEARDLVLEYDRSFKAINGASFNINVNDFVFITGKSGSGKSTLLNILASLDKASCGNVYYCGKRYGAMKEAELAELRGHNYGFVFQAYHLIPRINIENNIL